MNPPHGRPCYWTFAVISLFLLLNFAGDIVVPDGGPAWERLMSAVIAAVYLFGFLQSLERLFRPENALARTRALSDPARQKLAIARRVLFALFFIGIVAEFLVRKIGGKDYKDLSSDLRYMAFAFSIAAGLLGDICGERTLLPDSRVDFVTRRL
jgi:hypothetical protein